MSRTVISAVVAGVIVALTAIAFFVTSITFDRNARNEADTQFKRAHQMIRRINQLQSIDVSNKAERLAADNYFVSAFGMSGDDLRRAANLGFQKFMATETGATKPDIIALVNKKGELLAIHEVSTVVANQWLAPKRPGDDSVQTILPALTTALKKKVIISDSWNYRDKMLRVGVAPVVDAGIAAPGKGEPDDKNIIGAIVIAYAQTSQSAKQERELLGTEVAYFDGKRVVASSFTREGSEAEDSAKAAQLSELFGKGGLDDDKTQERQRVTIDDTEYIVAAAKMARTATKQLPADYPAMAAGAIVLSPVLPSEGAGTVKLFVVVLGLGALVIALLGLQLAHRRLLAQIDQVEGGVTDIINGNVDRTFRPVGPELDGLSNGLNVMLARLLGRPEPGEEEFDDDGNPIIAGRVEFDENENGGAGQPADPDLAALAQESEPDYYKRVYTEYLMARRATGHPDEVSFENFIAKLKVNEGKLRAQYQCRAVRFRVTTKDGKVSLKPVPIFA